MRWVLGTGLSLLAVSFLAFRARCTRYFAATSPRVSSRTWVPRLFPYLFFGANMICAVAVYGGVLEAK
jgi:hypothetical protein